MAAGNKCARKGWFHKPDWAGAALEYDKAALSYKNGKEWALATDAYKKVADSHKENGVLSASARALESAAACCKDGLKDAEKCAEFYRMAAETYHIDNKDDRAADALTKGAKAIDTLAEKIKDDNKRAEMYSLAVQLVKDGINFYEDAEKLAIYGLKAIKSAITIALRARLAEEAIGLYEKMILICVGDNAAQRYNDINKAALSLVILHLARGDEVSASRVFERECGRDTGNERTSFVHSDFGKCATKLLDAWDSNDQDAVDVVVKSQDVTFLDNELVRIARKLSVDGVGMEFVSLGKSSYVPINEEPASIALKPKTNVKVGDDDESGAGDSLSVGDKREIKKVEENERNRQLLFGSGSAPSKGKAAAAPKPAPAPKKVDDDVDDDDSDDEEFNNMLAKNGITADDVVKIEDDDEDKKKNKGDDVHFEEVADIGDLGDEDYEYDDGDLC